MTLRMPKQICRAASVGMFGSDMVILMKRKPRKMDLIGCTTWKGTMNKV